MHQRRQVQIQRRAHRTHDDHDETNGQPPSGQRPLDQPSNALVSGQPAASSSSSSADAVMMNHLHHHKSNKGTRSRKKYKKKSSALILFGCGCFLLGFVALLVVQFISYLMIDEYHQQQTQRYYEEEEEEYDYDDDSLPNGPLSFLYCVIKSAIRSVISVASSIVTHLVYRMSSSSYSSTFRQLERQPILVIGGSDGSGTRAVVDTIRELGGIIVADDSETFDIHASEMFHHQGWPGLIRAVLNITHSANFDEEDFLRRYDARHDGPRMDKELKGLLRSVQAKFDVTKRYYRKQYEFRMAVRQELGEVTTSQRRLVQEGPEGLDSHRRRDPRRGRHGGRRASPLPPQHPLFVHNHPTLFPAITTKVSYVIKAPASMLVLPLLAKYLRKPASYEPIKFLHVVRE
jgi:hypothetical protein